MSEFPCLINEYFSVYLKHVCYPVMSNNDCYNHTRHQLSTFTFECCRFLRAVAYRFIIRWLCGSMGWDNTRPLPACIYHEIRERFSSQGAHAGYLTAESRD